MINKNNISDALRLIAPQFAIKKVYLFGSYARNEQTYSSDVDLAIETDDVFSLLDATRFKRLISEALNSSVDLISRDSARGYLLDNILNDEVLLYERT